MDELFEDHQMAGPSKQKEQDIESWLWDWIVPRKLSIPSTPVPQAANSLIKGWIDCVKLDKDYPLISAVLNQVVNILAAYCSLQYLPTLLFHLGSLETSLHDLVAGAFDAFAQGMPAGIKLHTELATILSQVICFAEFARLFWSSLLAVILEQSGELLVFMNAFAIVVLGFKFYLCIASDAINIFLHLHWRFIHFLSAYVFRFHLMALQYSWGIMRRGKKARRNDLDQENVLPSIEHIVAGVLLFVPLLALLPTTVVFHCLTLAASTVTALPDALISRLMRMRSNIPRGIAVSHIPTIDDATVYQIKSRFH